MNKKSLISVKAQKMYDICEWLVTYKDFEHCCKFELLMIGREKKFDLMDLKMAGIAAKQHGLVVLLENDGYVWIGDYEEIARQIHTLPGHYIKKVY